MQSDIVLVTGPLVGASSWAPTADRLRAAGARVQVPDVLTRSGSAPSWSTWTSHLADLVSVDEEPILVGHSSASTLVADLATKIPVRGLIIVDGDIPPASGSAPPVRVTLHEFIAELADEDGLLPPWSQWWLKDRRRAQLVGIDTLALDHESFEAFEKGLPRMTLGWLARLLAPA
jgi:Alpha/beta hydrolase family